MNKDRKYELGRGMVEIIGALAIIGILSIVFIFSYKIAINKNKTNEIIDALSRRAVIASSQKENGANIDLAEFDEDTFTKQYNVTYQDEGDDFFSITMENVPDEVVQTLIHMNWKTPYNIYVDGIQMYNYDASKKSAKTSFASFLVKSAYAEEAGREVKLIFHKKLEAYDKKGYMDMGTCTGSGGRWEGGRCFCDGKTMTESGCKVCGKLYNDKDGTAKCGKKENDDSETGDEETDDQSDDDVTCYDSSECAGCAEICDNNGKCVLDKNARCNGRAHCEGTKIISCTKNGSKAVGNCLDSDPIVLEDCANRGSSYTCSEEGGSAKCVSDSVCQNNTDCPDCLDICVKGQCVRNKEDTCNGEEYCDGDQIVKCVKHGSRSQGPSTGCYEEMQVVEKCDNPAQAPRTCSMESGHAECVPVSKDCEPGYFKESNGECRSCGEIQGVTRADPDTTDCEKCPNVDVIINGHGDRICTAKCESGTYRGSSEVCEPCERITQRGYTDDANTTDCESCSGVDVIILESDGSRICTAKCSSGEFKDKDGRCVSCSIITSSGYLKEGSECDTCSGVKVIGHEYCATKCPSGKFGGKDGYPFISILPSLKPACYDCSDAVGKRPKSSNCDSCPGIEVINDVWGELCASKCEEGYEHDAQGHCIKVGCDFGEFKDENGNCISCELITSRHQYSAEETECAKCPGVSVATEVQSRKKSCYRR